MHLVSVEKMHAGMYRIEGHHVLDLVVVHSMSCMLMMVDNQSVQNRQQPKLEQFSKAIGDWYVLVILLAQWVSAAIQTGYDQVLWKPPPWML